MTPTWHDLSTFSLPPGFRGRSALKVQLWWIVQATLFRHSPQIAYGYRRWLLRAFGATVGKGVIIRPTATVTYPWKVTLGEHCWVGDNAVLYSLGDITIGPHSVISQGVYVCAGDHDYTTSNFAIRARPVTVGRECWIAAFSFLSPGCTVGDGAVVAARSTVLSHAEGGWLHVGNPSRAVKRRAPCQNSESSPETGATALNAAR